MNVLARMKSFSKFRVTNFTTFRQKHDTRKQKSKENTAGEREIFMCNCACKTALITGGSEGIGFQIAHQILANDGQKVAIVSNDSYKGKDTIDHLNCVYGQDKAIFVNCDIQSKVQVCECYSKVKDEFGKIDIVVNCAGIFDGCNWEKELMTNIIGTTRSTVVAYSYMNKLGSGEGGVILNIAGVFGLKTLYPAPTLAASHHGILGLSRSLGKKRNADKSGIRVVTLCPGFTNTAFLKGAEGRALNPTMSKELEKLLCKEKRQNPEVVGKAALHVLKYGTSGSVWVVEGSKLYSVKMPKWKNYRKLESQLM